MKNLYFLKILRKFCEFLKILSKFSQKFREKFRKFSKYGFVRGSGGGAPEASENIKKTSSKINGNQQNFENFHEFLANFDWKRLILIKIKANLMEF